MFDGLEELGKKNMSTTFWCMMPQVGVYPREIEELERRIEAGGWDLCIGKDSDQARLQSIFLKAFQEKGVDQLRDVQYSWITCLGHSIYGHKQLC